MVDLTTEASADEESIPSCRSSHFVPVLAPSPVLTHYLVRRSPPIRTPSVEVDITRPISDFLPCSRAQKPQNDEIGPIRFF